MLLGLAALLIGQKPTRSVSDVRRIVAQSARKVGADSYLPLAYGSDPFGTCSCSWHPYYGYGLIDAGAALALEPQTALTSFSPTSGAAGSTVVLTGTSFADVSAVTLNFRTAVFTVDSPTRITATVPAGLPPDSFRWRVTTLQGTAVNDALFAVTAA